MSSDWEDWEDFIDNPDLAGWIDVDWEDFLDDPLANSLREKAHALSKRGLRLMMNARKEVLVAAVGGAVIAILVAGAWHYRKGIKEKIVSTFGPILDTIRIGKTYYRVVRR